MFQHWFSLITLLTGIMVWGCGGGDPDRRIVTIYSPHGKPILLVSYTHLTLPTSDLE